MIHSLLCSLPDLFEEGEDTSSDTQGENSGSEDTKDILAGLDSPSPNTTTVDAKTDDTTSTDILGLQRSDTPESETPAHSRPTTPSSHFPRKPRISLTALLQHADILYERYPPTHPSIALDTIMGPQSVVFTWSQDPSLLPRDDEAELMVTRPDLVVLPIPEEEEPIEKDEEHKDDKRRRRKLRKSRRIVPLRRKTMVASAVLVLGIAVAVYGTGGFRGGNNLHRHGHREWRSLTRFVSAMFVGAGERLLDRLWG